MTPPCAASSPSRSVWWPRRSRTGERTKRQWLPGLTSGAYVGCFGLAEPGTGSDAGNLTTKAVRDGDDYVINGTKMFITNGTWADVVLLYAAPPTRPATRASPPSSCRPTPPA